MTKSLNVGLKSNLPNDGGRTIKDAQNGSGMNMMLAQQQGDQNVALSKSLASFHLTSGIGNGTGKDESGDGKKVESRQKILMDQSVDQLFKEGEAAAAQLMNTADGSRQETMMQQNSPGLMKTDSIALHNTSRNQQVLI